MTTRPRLATDVNIVNGVAAVALFAVLAYVFVTAKLPAPNGMPDGSVTASIGYALFDMTDQAAIPTESFLIAFEIIDVVLVAALVGAVMLARREEGGNVVTAITDGGRLLGDSAEETAENQGADGTDASQGGEA